MAVGVSRLDHWSDYWDNLLTEEGKVHFLLFLKERRDVQGDAVAGQALEKFASDWVKKVYRP